MITKVREALRNSKALLEELYVSGCEYPEATKEQIAENNEVLSKPLRNCDLYTNSKEAFMDWIQQCSQQNLGVIRWVDFINWLFTEVKG